MTVDRWYTHLVREQLPGRGPSSQNNEITGGPPEVSSAISLIGGVHIGARALLNPKLIWFGCITRLSQWVGGG
jgi:hypothetical protein